NEHRRRVRTGIRLLPFARRHADGGFVELPQSFNIWRITSPGGVGQPRNLRFAFGVLYERGLFEHCEADGAVLSAAGNSATHHCQRTTREAAMVASVGAGYFRAGGS